MSSHKFSETFDFRVLWAFVLEIKIFWNFSVPPSFVTFVVKFFNIIYIDSKKNSFLRNLPEIIVQ